MILLHDLNRWGIKMRHKLWIITLIIALFTLAACSGKEENSSEKELPSLDVNFEVSDSAAVDEKVDLIATVTYGEESVTDADEVVFEVWEQGREDDSVMIESTNNEDGTYTAVTSFDADGVYEIYAHTTARDLHTMPLKTITVGTGDSSESEEEAEHHHEHATEGFNLHIVHPEEATTGTDVDLTSHIQMDENPLEEANVRYEIWNDDISDNHEWADAEETKAGEYTAVHQFKEPGLYQVQVHVENNNGLHEHKQYEVEVK